MKLSKKLVGIPLLGLMLVLSAVLITSKDSSATVDCERVLNQFSVPTRSKTDDLKVISRGTTGKGSVHFFGITDEAAGVPDAKKDTYSNNLRGCVSFDTNGQDQLYYYTYTNDTPYSVDFALYDYNGDPVDPTYTKKTIAAGASYVDVVKLTGKDYYFTIYTKNAKTAGVKSDNCLANVTITPRIDDVGDIIDTGMPIEVSKRYDTYLIQGRPDVDTFRIESPGTALAVTVQNLSDQKDDQLTVRVTDRNGNEMSKFTVDAGLYKTQEVWKIQMKEFCYISISAPKSKNNVSYYVKADPITRRIEYVLGCEDATNDNPFVWSVGQVFTLDPAVREGYIFEGWFKDKNFGESSRVESITENDTTDMTLYAKWTKFSVGLPTDIKYVATKKSITFEFVKAENATYTVFTCNGKTYKVNGTKVTIKGLKKNKRYSVKIHSVWLISGVGECKSKDKLVSVKTKRK